MEKEKLYDLIAEFKVDDIKSGNYEDEWTEDLAMTLVSTMPERINLIPPKFLTRKVITYYKSTLTGLYDNTSYESLPIISNIILKENRSKELYFTLVLANFRELPYVPEEFISTEFFTEFLSRYFECADSLLLFREATERAEILFSNIIKLIPVKFINDDIYGYIIKAYILIISNYDSLPYAVSNTLDRAKPSTKINLDILNLPEYILTDTFVCKLCTEVYNINALGIKTTHFINPRYMDKRRFEVLVKYSKENNIKLLSCFRKSDISYDMIVTYFKSIYTENPYEHIFKYMIKEKFIDFIDYNILHNTMIEDKGIIFNKFFYNNNFDIFDDIVMKLDPSDLEVLMYTILEQASEVDMLVINERKTIDRYLNKEHKKIIDKKFVLISERNLNEFLEDENNYDKFIDYIIEIYKVLYEMDFTKIKKLYLTTVDNVMTLDLLKMFTSHIYNTEYIRNSLTDILPAYTKYRLRFHIKLR